MAYGIRQLKGMDVVYLVKDTPTNLELKYSLRSVEENLPHRKVWLIGGCPEFIDKRKVHHVYTQQDKKATKWNNTNHSLQLVCENDNISDDFILFNDDFFVMRPVRELGHIHDRTLQERINDFSRRYPSSRYVERLKQTLITLRQHGINEPLNFELHLPMVFNKQKLKDLYKAYGDSGAKRTIYGNLYAKDSTQHKDIKLYRINTVPSPEWQFLSTTDASFALGIAGRVVRNKFLLESKYERKGVE